MAQRWAEFKAARPQPAKLVTNQLLRELVQIKLEERLSPEQIAAWLRREFPTSPEM